MGWSIASAGRSLIDMPMNVPMNDNERQRLSRSYLLPVEDSEFLLRDELRGIRFALEYSKAELLLREWGIRSTVIVFGSARTPSQEQAEAMLLEDKLDGTSFTDDELELLTTLSNQAMVAIENAWLYERVKHNYFATIQSLVNALEANDKYTKGHSERVRYLSIELGKYIGLDYRELEVLEHAAILHDIGKIGIESMVLNKEGKLTASEYSLVKAHPLIGDEILGPIDTLAGVRTTIIQHHERYDGGGYPYGIPGEEISLKARILAIIDTFDAMLTDRPYRRALSIPMAKEELRQGAGTQFDPYLTSAFLDLLEAREEELLMTAGYNFSLIE